jgi:hypothetical protein
MRSRLKSSGMLPPQGHCRRRPMRGVPAAALYCHHVRAASAPALVRRRDRAGASPVAVAALRKRARVFSFSSSCRGKTEVVRSDVHSDGLGRRAFARNRDASLGSRQPRRLRLPLDVAATVATKDGKAGGLIEALRYRREIAQRLPAPCAGRCRSIVWMNRHRVWFGASRAVVSFNSRQDM